MSEESVIEFLQNKIKKLESDIRYGCKMSEESVIEFLQNKIKKLELDVQYDLHQIEEKEKRCKYLEQILKENNVDFQEDCNAWTQHEI